MNNTQKNYLIISLLVIIVALLAGGLFYFRKANVEMKSDVVIEDSFANTQIPEKIVNKIQENNTVRITPTGVQSTVSKIQSYSGNNFSFDYPSILTLKEENGEVTVSHSAPYKHYDFCDMKGGGSMLNALNDFQVSIKVVNQSVQEYLKTSGWPEWDYVSHNPYKFGPYSGYHVTPGVEGCGLNIYYLVISSNKTVVITSPLVPEFSPINTDYKKAYEIAGVIIPSRAEEYFLGMISTLKVR